MAVVSRWASEDVLLVALKGLWVMQTEYHVAPKRRHDSSDEVLIAALVP